MTRRRAGPVLPLAVLTACALAAGTAPAQDAPRRAAAIDCAALAAPELQRHCRGAAAGDVDAMTAFGMALFFGDGGLDEPATGLALWRAASSRGAARADFILGLATAHGWPPAARDRDAGVALLRRAGEAGYRHAWYELAQLHLEGDAADIAAGLAFARRGADAGDHASLRLLGTLYDRGRGVARDRAEAQRLWRLAAGGADADAYFELGRHRRDGIAGAADADTAIRLFQIAAGLGHRAAQLALAALLFEPGAPPAPGAALAWLRDAAAADGAAPARAAVERLADAVARDPAGWAVQARLGDALAALGEREGARAAWRRALPGARTDAAAEPDIAPATLERRLAAE